MAKWDQAPAVKSASAAVATAPVAASRWQAAPTAASPIASAAGQAPTSAQQRYDKAIQAIIDANPGLPPEDFASLKEHYGPASLMDLAQSGTTFGLSDELAGLAGGLGSLMKGGKDFGGAYQRWSELQAAREALGREKAGMLGNVVEGGTSLLTMAPEKAAIEAMINGTVRAAPTLLKTVAASTGTGGALGALSGAANSDGGLNDRLVGAVKGGLGGAAFGAVLPVAARGASSLVDSVLSSNAAKQAAKVLGIDPEAAKFVQTRLAADNSLSPAGAQRMAAAGPEATLADAGPSARNALDYAVQSSGKAGQVARQAIDERVGRDTGAINTVLDTTLGQPVGVNTARAATRSATAGARSAAYGKAYAQPIDYASSDGRDLEALLQRVPKQAVDRANLLMKIQGEKSSQIMATIADDGSVTFKKMPDVRQLDYITRALNEEAKSGIGAGAMGGQTAVGSALGDLSRDIRDTLRLHVPEYGDALAEGQGAIQTSQAIKNGYELLRPSTTREDVAGWARGLSQADRAAAAQGIRSHISDAVSNVSRTLTDGDVPAREALKVLRDLSTTASRDKVAQVIGQPAADQLFGELDRATKSFELRAAVADNSKTFQRQEMGRQVDAVTNPQGIVATLARGEPVNAGKRAIQAVTGFTPERALAAKDAMMQDVVKALLARGGAATASMGTLSRLASQRAGAGRIASALINTGAISGPAAYLTGRQAAGSQQ